MKEFIEKVDEYDSFEMFTKAGDNKCRSITKKTVRKVFGKKRITQQQLEDFVALELKKVDQSKFGEIYDTEPPSHIAWLINEALKLNDYSFEVSRYNFY